MIVLGGGNKTLDKVYQEMIGTYKNKDFYSSLYNKFIKDILGNKNIQDLTSNDIDYFYIYLTNKTHGGHFYSKNYIKKIMNLLKKFLNMVLKKNMLILI